MTPPAIDWADALEGAGIRRYLYARLVLAEERLRKAREQIDRVTEESECLRSR